MSASTLHWYKIAEHPDELSWGENNLAPAEAAGKKICIGRFQEELFAFAARCPHAGGLLQEGYIDAMGRVVCPLHRYKFDMSNGRNVSGEGYYLKHWAVEQRNDGVFVGMPLSGFAGWW